MLFVVQSLSPAWLFVTRNCSTPGFHCPLTPRVYSNSCPLSWWCQATTSFSVATFSSCPQSFPASGSFPNSHLFAWGGQRIGASSSASNFQWILRVDFLWDWLICSPCCPKHSQESSPTPQFKSISSLVLSLLYGQLSHLYMTTGKNIALTIWTFVAKVMSLFFNMPSRFVITFLPRRKHLLISWLQSPFAVILYSHWIFKCILSPVSRFQSCLLDLAIHLLTKKLNSLNEDRLWTLSHWCYLSIHIN